ncbi:acetyltransferase (GNAT) family protein [Kribbella sp. VKM Ac-2527]|uniref:Acetyltransferase (GNAT) family protein n=1 Tax=Kribbella caucasensis TaxID=2512215 RepID=A0A4R6JJD5_9ACTN|nr:GNAT family N-acetyltransferase [Kribbella sp. VKM Ac-2527]TDO34796.1 acetyltransferase (GNAT) family protein [Kribbella sp. VKM Ac-2527]
MVGFADCTLGDVADCIVEPGFDRMTDGWLVLAADGLPVGYGTTFGKGDREMIGIEVTSQHPSVAAWLYERTMQRALEMGRLGGHAEITVDAFAYHADGPLRALLADHAFAARTTYNRMWIDHSEPVAAPQTPRGVVVRRGAFDDATRSTAHEVLLGSFRGQFGFVPRPHDEWIAERDARSTIDWSQLTLLEVDGKAVALRDCSDSFIQSDNCGHIAMLGVLEEYRGRGLAKFLLRDAFALDAAAGRAGTILLVDTNNPTPALGLYLSVGMNPTLVFEGWRRVLPVT